MTKTFDELFRERLLEILPELEPDPAVTCPDGCKKSNDSYSLLCRHGVLVHDETPNFHQFIIDEIKKRAGIKDV